MLCRGTTVSDAAHRWVEGFNRFPQDMISKLMLVDIDSWREVTAPRLGDFVYLSDIPTEDKNGNEYEGSDQEGEVVEVLERGDVVVELNDGTEVAVEDGYFEVQRYYSLPMWGTMWQFGDSADDFWLEELGGVQAMSDCGFRIYESDEWGYFFGIDGCGYDFYESHWIPLYKKRGLKLHDPATELTEEEVVGFLNEFIEDEKLIKRLLDLEKGNSINVGGPYEYFFNLEQAQKLDKVGWFAVDFRPETIQEIDSKNDNYYYTISRAV